jgi:predicted type IV restriction endonuclease
VEPIDAAHQAFRSLKREVSGYIGSVETEADTRLKVIDRMLLGVLLWPYDQVQTEPATPSGFADYACRVQNRTRLILEAKRDGRPLGLQGRQSGRAYKLSGGVFNADAAREGITQAIRYCGEKNAELACVTNGQEWIVFRGNRVGDGTDTLVRQPHFAI